jgi:signal transduction histidine kinase
LLIPVAFSKRFFQALPLGVVLMRWPLRYQILLPFALVMLVALAGVTAFSAVLAARRTEAQLASQLDGIASTLRDASFPLSENVLLQMRGLSGAEFVVTSAGGTLMARTVEVEPDMLAEFRRDAGAAATTNPFDFDRMLKMHGETYFHLWTPTRPMSDGSRPILHILYSEARWREARSEAILPPLIVGSAALGLVGVVSVVLSRRLSGPIGQLRAQVSRMAQGDYQPIPQPRRNDELRDLAESVNSLASQLDELHRVIQRTERLAVLGQLAGGLAHELRNSVAGARLAVQLHERACDANDPESLTVALRQLELTETQLRRFLAVGKPSTPTRTWFDLRDIVEDVLALVAPACQHRKISVESTSPEQPIRVLADRDQLRQLLLNLVLNAIDAESSGGRDRIEADITSDESARLRVFDTGAGPPPELAERMFEPFVTTKPEGVGLGLAVARQIAEAHGGSLRLCRGEETCFELLLPREAENAEPRDALPQDNLANREATVPITTKA